MGQLYEDYRPTKWSEVVGQADAISTIKRMRERGLGGRAFWISGLSGTGKTTIARLLALELADGLSIDEKDATGYMPSDVEDDARWMRCRSLVPPHGQVKIINEAHGLRNDTIRKLLVVLEDIAPHGMWIFTTTKIAQTGLFDQKIDASPLLSRCIELELECSFSSFANRAKKIAEECDLDGRPIEEYIALAKERKGNMRAMLQDIEAGKMLGGPLN